MSAELVGPLPTITFQAGYMQPRIKQAYDVPRDTCDPRYSACTDHHPACDCREAEHAEEMAEHRGEWKRLRETAARAMSGHQVKYPFGLSRGQRATFPLCLCTGCVIHREVDLLSLSSIDFRTGRVR